VEVDSPPLPSPSILPNPKTILFDVIHQMGSTSTIEQAEAQQQQRGSETSQRA